MTTPEHAFDADLVRRAQSGDLAAYGRLVEATSAQVRAAVRSVLTDAASVDDAVQDTYLRAHRGLRALRDAQAFPAWLRRVAVSTARNAVRRRRGVAVDPRRLDALPSRTPEDAEDDALHRALRRAIADLPTRERRLCDRYYRGGWTTTRLAADAGLGESAIRKRLQRLRDLMRKQLELSMSTTTNTTDGDGALSARIVELLSRPRLIDLPENPVGEVWGRVRALRCSDEVVDLPEELHASDLAAICGAGAVLPARVHWIAPERVLRWDLSVPMLLAARGRAPGTRLVAAGKVYRDETEDAAHLQAFHQAEMLWIGERLAMWSAMDVIEDLLDDLLPGAALRVTECDFPLIADRGHEVEVRVGDEWISVAGWARYADSVVAAIGGDPERQTAIGVGLGLERIAALRHDIDDIRRIETSRIDG